MNKLKINLSKRNLFYLAIAGLLVIGGAVFFGLRNSSNQEVKETVKTVNYSTDTPSEDPIAEPYNWSGNPSDPKYISLPTINSEGYIQRVGVDQNKQVAVPDNINMAGWFVDSVTPSQKGLSIIDGHVSGRYHDAIFKNLVNLKVGDHFQVTLGNGRVLDYKVINIQSVSVAQAPSVLFSQDPKVSSQLNLITCGGNYDESQKSFDHRVIVGAELAG